MSKKSRKNKMDVTKFKSVICSQCSLCAKGFNPKFCFRTLYKRNPDKFISIVKSKLDEHMMYVKQFAVLPLDQLFNNMVTATVFRNIFCSKEICVGCKAGPDEVGMCITRFKLQVDGDRRLKSPGNIRIIKSNKSKEVPKVTVFMSDNPEFKSEVNRILENFNKQSNSDREYRANTERCAGNIT